MPHSRWRGRTSEQRTAHPAALAAGADAAKPRVALKAATTATDATGAPTLIPAIRRVFETSVAKTRFSLDCTYAASNAEALALPAYKGLPATIFVKPYVCRALNVLVRKGCPTSAEGQFEAGSALLILIHESVHVSPFAGAHDEALTQTEAMRVFLPMAASLGIDKPCAAILSRGAPRRAGCAG